MMDFNALNELVSDMQSSMPTTEEDMMEYFEVRNFPDEEALTKFAQENFTRFMLDHRVAFSVGMQIGWEIRDRQLS